MNVLIRNTSLVLKVIFKLLSMETVKLLQSSLVVERDLMSLNNFLLEFLI